MTDTTEKTFAMRHTRFNSIAIISPSVREDSRWQVTRVDEYGPYSDSQCDTHKAAAKLAWQEGFKLPTTEDEVNAFIINGKELKKTPAGA